MSRPKRLALPVLVLLLAALFAVLWMPAALADEASSVVPDTAYPAESKMTPEQLASVTSLDLAATDEGVDTAEELPVVSTTQALTAASTANPLDFTPWRNEVWPLSSGKGFCYAQVADEVMTIYRYLLDDGTSQQIGSVAINKHYDKAGSVYYSNDFCHYVSGDRLYYVEGRYDWSEDTVFYTLRCLDMATGSTSEVFTRADTELDGCRSIGVDAAGHVYWADFDGNTIYVLSQTGDQLASAAIPKATIEYSSDYSYSTPILSDFVGFDATNGNFYFTGTCNWVYWGYSHAMEALYLGNFDGSNIVMNEKAITTLYQQGYYAHYGSVEFLNERYLADLSTFTGGSLAVLDSHAIGVNDVTDTETTIYTSGGVGVTTVALPAETVVFGTDTHESDYQNNEDISGVGARCAYFSDNDLLAVDKGSNQIVAYTLASSEALGTLHTTYETYKLMNLGNELVALERDGDGGLYVERFSLAPATEITLSGASKLAVGDKADYTVRATGDLQADTSFESSDSAILSIDAVGRASAHKEGTAVITAKTKGGLSDTLTVTVAGGGVSKTLPDVLKLSGSKVDNWNWNSYQTYGNVVGSYLAETASGLMRVQAQQDSVLVEYYDASGNVTSSRTVPFELPIFGGYFAGADGSHYLVFGQSNYDEDDSVTVMRVVRYDSSWNRVGSYDLKGANTYIPFDAGSLRMAEADGKLYVYTCHEMYDDGDDYHHQANLTLVLQESDMSLVDSFYDMMNLSYGYVSHSFNQFVRVVDGILYRVDHGDSYPRGIAFTATKIADKVTSPFATGTLVPFEGSTGANYTGASVGGMEITDSCAVVAFNMDASFGQTPRNVYVVAEDLSYEGNAVGTALTSYAEGSTVTCLTPQLVRVNDRHLLCMWAETDSATGASWAKFALLDHSGNVVKGPVQKALPLSDCQPIVLADGSVAWYVSTDKACTLYTINPYDLDAMSEDNFDNKFFAKLSDAVIGTIENQVYTGEELTPEPTVSLGGRKLVLGTDYELSYKDNVDVGTATVTATGKGSYAGSKSTTFTITAATVKPEVTLADSSVEYTGREQKPSVSKVTATLGSKTVTIPSSSYTVSYPSGCTNVGSYTVTVTLKGNYKGTGTASFEITPAEQVIAASDKSVACGSMVAIGAKITAGGGKLSYKSSNDKVASVDASGNVLGRTVGTVTITITAAAADNYRATSKTVEVTVTKGTPTLTVAGTSVVIGKTAQLHAETNSDGALTYESSDPSVVSVSDSGELTGNALGSAVVTVTVTATDNYEAASKTVTIKVQVDRREWKRLYGKGSLDTMSAIVEEGWEDGAGGTVVIARNDDFKDALAASGLAGLTGSPIVLTSKDKLADQAAVQLRRLKPTRVYVAGGAGAISANVVDAICSVTGLAARSDNTPANTGVIRVYGKGSPETSAALAQVGGGWKDDTAIIVTNASFKDALSVAPISYAMHWPILLASGGKELKQAEIDWMKGVGIKQVYIMGGAAAVTPEVESQLEGEGIAVAGRKRGKSAWQTSRVIADWGLELGLSADGMGYATSQRFPDALAGAALLGKGRSVLLLADEATQGNLSFAQDHAQEISHGYVFGGKGAFSEDCYDQLPK